MDFSQYKFAPVMNLPDSLEVFDFSKGYDSQRELVSGYGIGKYNEKRPTMYDQPLFGGERNIHMGIDIAAPAGSEVMSFYDGEIFLFGNNSDPGDYGFTIICKYQFEKQELYALYGHLSAKSIEGKSSGQKIKAGQVIAWLGDKSENGGWNPHLHFQLSTIRPDKADLPGVVSKEQHEQALKDFPDPRLVLGPLY